MPGQNTSELPKRRARGHEKGNDPPTGQERFTIDRETLEHLPSELHRMVAEARIRDGTWTLIDSEKKEAI